MKIFISVSDSDRSRVEEVVLALQGDGHKVFFYKYSLLPGDTFHKQIRDAIGQADMMLFFVTPRSIDPKRYTRTELEIARSIWPHPRNRVLPVELDPVDMKAVPAYLREVTFCKPQGNLAGSVAHEVARMEKRIKEIDKQQSPTSEEHVAGTFGPRWLDGIFVGIGLAVLAIFISYMTKDEYRTLASKLGHIELATLHGLTIAVLLWIAAIYFGVRDPASYAALAAGSVGAYLLGVVVGQLKPPDVALYLITSLTVPAFAALTLPAFRLPQHWGGFVILGLVVALLMPFLKIVGEGQLLAWEALTVGLVAYVLSVPRQTPRRSLLR